MKTETSEDSGYLSRDLLNSSLKKERRKVQKVIAERRRRERIDRCLEQLKFILIANQTLPRGTDFEKTDILELTLRHVKNLQKQLETDKLLGFLACLRETQRFLFLSGVELKTIRHLTEHVQQNCAQSLLSAFQPLYSIPNNNLHKFMTAKVKVRKVTSRNIAATNESMPGRPSSSFLETPREIIHPMFTSTPQSSLSSSTLNHSSCSIKQVLFHESSSFVEMSRSESLESPSIQGQVDKTIWRPWLI